MNTIIDMVAMEVRLNYVSSSWVAWYYGQPLANVYAAVESGRLIPVEVQAAKRMTLLFDRRTLPLKWPSRVTPAQKHRNRRRGMKAA